MVDKKTKLTISGSPKRSLKSFESSKVQGKKTVIIEKNLNKPLKKSSFNKTNNNRPSSGFKRGTPFKPNFPSKLS